MNPIMQGIQATALLALAQGWADGGEGHGSPEPADEPLMKAPPATCEPAAWVVLWRPKPAVVGATRRFVR